MIIKLFILVMVKSITSSELDSLDDLTSYNQLVLSDWDSTLYNKPLCVPIPSNMSLCSNINYKEMKVPNLLGHETIEEIQYQASVWMPLLKAQCSQNTQMFLCSLFAPVCVEHQSIYPCRSLCESVKSSCSQKMLSYGYQWPEIFNCSKFPADNGLCMPSLENQETATSQTTSTIKPTTTTITKKTTFNSMTTNANNKLLKKMASQMTCHGCTDNSTVSSMKNIVTSYCNSDIVIRARIPGIKSSRFDLFKQKTSIRLNRTLSQYISVPRRDRKFLKGYKLSMNNNYLTEKGLLNEEDDLDEDDDGRNDNLDIYLLSNYHLNLAQSLNKNADVKRLKMRSLYPSNQCKCDRLKKNLKQKTRYLVFGKVLRLKKTNLKPVDSRFRLMRNKRFSNATLSLNKRRHMRQHQQQNLVKIVYLNGFFTWNNARAFVDYIEDDTIDKKMMCNDIDATVSEINRVRQMLL